MSAISAAEIQCGTLVLASMGERLLVERNEVDDTEFVTISGDAIKEGVLEFEPDATTDLIHALMRSLGVTPEEFAFSKLAAVS